MALVMMQFCHIFIQVSFKFDETRSVFENKVIKISKVNKAKNLRASWLPLDFHLNAAAFTQRHAKNYQNYSHQLNFPFDAT